MGSSLRGEAAVWPPSYVPNWFGIGRLADGNAACPLRLNTSTFGVTDAAVDTTASCGTTLSSGGETSDACVSGSTDCSLALFVDCKLSLLKEATSPDPVVVSPL